MSTTNKTVRRSNTFYGTREYYPLANESVGIIDRHECSRRSVPYVSFSYTWEGDFEGMRVEASELYAASFGIGAAINCFFSLNNMDAGDGSFGGVSGIDRSDPGAGGYTYFHGREGYAYDDIETGFELFLDYGASYFEDGKAEAYGIPHEKDKKVARSMLNKFLNQISPAIHNATKNESIAHDIVTELYETLVVPNRWSPPSRILNAMPLKFQWIEGTLKEGMNYAHYNRSIRSLDWLHDHGSCSDNVRVGTSTVPHAGRGAFLVRPVRAGETILPMPLIHVGNRSWMDMRYSGKDILERENAKTTTPEPSIVHQQMLLNYCFGHAETDILLCPYGIANGLVNHAPTSEQVNARLQWSTRLSLRPEWLDLPPSEWIWNETSGLVLELVATRNLQAGEEILMDYSSEWDAAWKKHVSEWQPPPDASQYMPVEDILVSLENGDLTMPLKNETLGGPFENIEEVLCHHFYLVHFGFEASLDEFDAEDLYPCRPLSSYLSSDGMTVLYNVEVDYRHFDFANSRCKDETQGIFLAVSAQVFDLREKPYSRDQAQPWSFRHDMRIPDDIFPSAWRTKTNSTLEAPTCINE